MSVLQRNYYIKEKIKTHSILPPHILFDFQLTLRRNRVPDDEIPTSITSTCTMKLTPVPRQKPVKFAFTKSNYAMKVPELVAKTRAS